MQKHLLDIQNKIQQYVEKQKRKEGLEKLFLLLIYVSIIFFPLTVLESIFHFSKSIRTVIVYLFLSISFFS